MSKLHRALNDIELIRAQIAKSDEFLGFGTLTLSATGILAIVIAALQGLWLRDANTHPGAFVAVWSVVAGCSILIISIEVLVRSRRFHGSLAMPLMQTAAEHLCPPLAAGALLTVAFLRADPSAAWLLPGLWDIIFSLGVFAMARMLPKPVFVVGVWYLLCGLVSIQRGPESAFSGWSMGIPFGVGQLLVAVILNLWSYGNPDPQD